MKGKYGNSVTVEITGTQAVVRFDRGVNRNAIDQDTLLALTHVARDLAESLAVHTVLLTGAADIFSAGIDLKDPRKWQEDDTQLLVRRDIAQRGARLCRLWEELPQLTIAAIEGAAVGGSVALALACDWRVAAENAILYLPEAKVGLNMGWGAIPRMVNLIGAPRAKRAILLAEKLGMAQALDWGLVDEVVPRGQALARAQAMAAQASQTPPAILRMTKESVNLHANALNRLGIYMDADQALVCRDSDEGKKARERFLAN
ncbi:enoyl-CoA hydratase/isomerase family protein [Bordetella hinzii]|uniref:Enoyl-CoA hydratase/isomerase family protein n=2 Tax=Bordetella hinzii TaxID=103855 RepID=A0AAN1RZ81_9BORD|nr:enoyl-CoA hydratase/isomerase family protein [Bordetella hinzii]AKQ60166.1 putative enoyl-CoA hydratase [Bordetella hinzii]AZW18754.1 enoyl-CoA hydratase/isomerase family protein [Bordetella hinzii]KCB42912.1 enoyl-CoA hydratase/isomerase family protein [Bordetella hinzii 4161]MBZ0081548.1 enoyl-CoA hydratase/isomerase family protein [Bordetella hinzii]MBZ0085823.1 enoyl-CoA hydratase/isomerase family protein [Bordetella hinzii]